MTIPYYYSKLAPFREVFRTGYPVLNYHHIAPPRRGARLKWLYLRPELFAGQIADLRSGGFSTSKFLTVLSPAPLPVQALADRPEANPQLRVYLTFDDGFRDVFDSALPLLLQHRYSSILYLVSGLLGKSNEWQLKVGDVAEPLMDDVQVREWLAAGQEIGSHSHNHPHLTQIPLLQAREEITASKKSLEDHFGVPIEHFSYPYGEWNNTIRDLVIDAGYKTACTIEPGVNTIQTSPFELKRLIVRTASRTFKDLWQRLRHHLGITQAPRNTQPTTPAPAQRPAPE